MNKHNHRVRYSFLTLFFGYVIIGPVFVFSAEIAVKDGQAIAFVHDQSLKNGNLTPTTSGYVPLLIAGLKANGIGVTAIPAANSTVRGSNKLVESLKQEVFEKQPKLIVFSCGVAGTWDGKTPMQLDRYKQDMTVIVDQCKAAGVKTVLVNASMIGRDFEGAVNKAIEPYNDFIQALAKDKQLLFADFNSRSQTYVRSGEDRQVRVITSDGVRLAPSFDYIKAQAILKALGFDNEQLAKADQAMLDVPGGALVWVIFNPISLNPKLTLREYGKLEIAVMKEKMSVDGFLKKTLEGSIRKNLKLDEQEKPEIVGQKVGQIQADFMSSVKGILDK